jgi:hypothetical protein
LSLLFVSGKHGESEFFPRAMPPTVHMCVTRLLVAYLRVTSFITSKNFFTLPSLFPRKSVINESASPVLLDTPTPRFPLYQHGSQKSVLATPKNSLLSKNKVYSERKLVLHSFPFLLNKFYVTLSTLSWQIISNYL